MKQLKIFTIEIKNFEKYNPRKDIKATTWFRLQNSLFEDPGFFDFKSEQILFWIYLLSVASKKQCGSIELSFAHAERVGRFSRRTIRSSLLKLTERGCIHPLHSRNAEIPYPSPPSAATNETDRTLQTNTDMTPPERECDLNFEKAFEAYLRKEGKRDAQTCFNAAIKTPEDYKNLFQAILNYSSRCEGHKVEARFIKLFFNFIAKENWKEWIVPASDLPPPQPKSILIDWNQVNLDAV